MAQDYIDDSNPFSRSGKDAETKFEYGPKGRTIDTSDKFSEGAKDGTSPAQDGVGKAGDGGPVGD